MKKLFMLALAVVTFGLAGCNDNDDNGKRLPEIDYEEPIFLYGKTREEVKAAVPYRFLSENDKSLYFKGEGIVKQYTYIFNNDRVFSCGAIASENDMTALHEYLSYKYIFVQYRPSRNMYVFRNEDSSLQIGLYPIGDGLIAVEYMQ